MARLRGAIRDLLRAATAAPAARRAAAPALRPPSGAPPPGALARRFDEWAALQDIDGPEAQRLLREEDAAAQAFFADTAEFEQRVQGEAARVLEPEAEAEAEIHGPFRYFQRHTPEGFAVFCRAPAAGGAVEVMLDTSELAQTSAAGVAEVTVCKVSDDHRTLAYIADVVGDESYEMHFKTLGEGGGTWSARLPGVRSAEFLGGGGDGCAAEVLAVHMDPQTRRASRIVHHHVSRDGGVNDGELLWDETNQAAYLEVFRTKDREFVLLSSNTKDTSEVRVVRCRGGGSSSSTAPAPAPLSPRALLPPRVGVEYFAEHQAGAFYVISNHERRDFAVYTLPADAVAAAGGSWEQLVPCFVPPGEFHVTDADLLRRWLVLYGHEAAEPRVCAVPIGPAGSGCDLAAPAAPAAPAAAASPAEPGAAPRPYLAALPSPVGAVEPGVNADPDAATVRFTFRSPLEPGATYDLELATGQTKLVSRRAWRPAGDLGPDAFQCERMEYPARDGARVPLTLVRPKHDAGLSPRPCLLHVYGAYGSCLVPDFRLEHMVLLRRGWAIAWAHVRGGGERGRAWHIAGRQLKKAQSVLDLADGARFLLARGIAAPGGLCVKAASAGGLTLGALLNSPEGAALFAGAVLEVPFVDALTGMSDPDLPLTVHEFAEWGDPRDPVHEASLRSLCPYENVGPHAYPHLYLSCARADARVPAWMPLKLATRLRARAPRYLAASAPRGGARRRRASGGAGGEEAAAEPSVVLHCGDGGHGGATDWHGRSEEFARQLAFLHKAVALPL